MSRAPGLYYALDGHTPVPCQPSEWRRQVRADPNAWIVARSEPLEGVEVATDFTGMSHLPRKGDAPLVFETIVFGGPLDNRTWHASTWEEAEQLHARIVQMVCAEASVHTPD